MSDDLHIEVRPPAAFRDAFVGRVPEGETLRAALSESEAGRGRIVLLCGEAGIGKTRLASELSEYAISRGDRVIWGRCWESGGAPAYWPWIEALRKIAGDRQFENPNSEIQQTVREVSRLIPNLRTRTDSGTSDEVQADPSPSPAAQGLEPVRFRLFDAVATLLGYVTRTGALMLVLDDLHAADPDSLLLLHFIARSIRQTRLLIIAIYRESGTRHTSAVGSAIAQLAREGYRINLVGLSRPEVSEFIHRKTGFNADEPLVSSLFRTTEGNPFFLEEIARLIIAGHGNRDPNELLSDYNVPDGVRAAIRQQASHLQEGTTAVLKVASVIGHDFSLSLLAKVMGRHEEELARVLEEALEEGIVVAGTDGLGHYRFSHAMIPETLKKDIAAKERARLNRRIAETMEATYGADIEQHLSEIANHFLAALPLGVAAKAVEYTRRSAERARDKLAFEEAAALFRQALRALASLSEPDDEQRCRVLVELGNVESKAGHRKEADREFQRAAELARKMGRHDLLGRAALGSGIWSGSPGVVDRKLVGLLEEALTKVRKGDESLKALLLARLATELYWSNLRERAFAQSLEAVRVARRINDVGALLSALWTTHTIIWSPEKASEKLDAANEMTLLAGEANRPDWALKARELRIAALCELGRILEATEEIESYTLIAQESGELTGMAERFRIMIALLKGDYDVAALELQKLFSIGQHREDPMLLIAYGGQLMMLRGDQEGPDAPESEPMLKEGIAQFPALVSPRCGLALLYARQGRRPEAKVEFEYLANDGFAGIPRDWNWLGSIAMLAEVCSSLGDANRAKVLYQTLEPYAERNITLGWGELSFGSAARYLGLLAAAMKRYDKAVEHFQAAQEFDLRIGARPAVARGQLSFAETLLLRGNEDDLREALDLAQSAEAIASTLGMKGVASRASILISRLANSKEPERTASLQSGVRNFGEPTATTCQFRKEGDIWTITYEGQTLRLRDFKGLSYIARLLQNPEQEFHAGDLVSGLNLAIDTQHSEARAELVAMTREQLAERNLRVSGLDDAGEMLDSEAKAAYARRLKELREELEEAEEFRDTERAAKAEDEIEELSRELGRAIGRGGRDRRAGSASERARLSVTRAIKVAIERVAEKHSKLAIHLTASIRTGTFCRYHPDPRKRPDWRF